MNFRASANHEHQNTQPSPSWGESRRDGPMQTSPARHILEVSANIKLLFAWITLCKITLGNKAIKFTLLFSCFVLANWFNFPFPQINNNVDSGKRTKVLFCKILKKAQKPNLQLNIKFMPNKRKAFRPNSSTLLEQFVVPNSSTLNRRIAEAQI